MEVDQQKYYVYYHLYIWCVSCAAVSTIATSVETSFAILKTNLGQKNLFDATCLGWTVDDTTRTVLVCCIALNSIAEPAMYKKAKCSL